jgi:two-component system, OmpR family, response regulator MprA
MPKRILIAEDDFAAREALTRLAEIEGYQVIAVADGAELLALADTGKFDLVITDLLMPDLNGVAANQIMRFKGDQTPIIAITGMSPQDTDHLKGNFAGIFYKPIDAGALFGYIGTLLQGA